MDNDREITPEIYRLEGKNFWYCKDAIRISNRLKAHDWLYNGTHHVWWVQDDERVLPFIEYVRPEFKELLQDNLAARAGNYRKSLATYGEIAWPGVYDFQMVPQEEIGKRNLLLADEMGLGKTIEAIFCINRLKPKNCLIIVPNTLVMKWYAELQKWLAFKECQIYIVPWSQVIRQDLNFYWDLIIVDEAHYAKNPSSKRSQAFQALKGKKRIALTGTPILSRPLEVFPIVNWLQPYSLGIQSQFERRYEIKKLEWYRNRSGLHAHYKTTFEIEQVQKLQKKLRETCMIARQKSVVLPQLPPKLRSTVEIDFGKEVSKLDKRMIALFKEIQRDKKNIELWQNIFALRHEAALLKLPKVAAFIQDTWEESQRPMVVFAHHQDVIDGLESSIYNNCTKKVVKIDGRNKAEVRERIINEFQEGEHDIIVVGLTVGGVGITLTRADVAVFAELDWTPANLVQAEDRLHRIGQENAVNIYYCVSGESLDARIAGILETKQEVIDAFTQIQV